MLRYNLKKNHVEYRFERKLKDIQHDFFLNCTATCHIVHA